MKRQSRVKGIAISYVSTAVRTLSKLFLTPIYLRVLGLDDYGFYQYIFSIASYVTILDFGITSVINTFSIKYREEGNEVLSLCGKKVKMSYLQCQRIERKKCESNMIFLGFVFYRSAKVEQNPGYS